MREVEIGGLSVSNDSPLLVIAGPCQLESLDHAQMIAGKMAEACAKAGAQYVFKASYDKANRTSLKGRRGLGIDAGLKVLEAVRAMGMPVLTDIHDAEQARLAAQVVDVIQIPAFLCRQTDLLIAAGETGAVVNIKKGQFLAPWDMANVPIPCNSRAVRAIHQAGSANSPRSWPAARWPSALPACSSKRMKPRTPPRPTGPT
jgi:2-dehydro-3-deoxyphosphooctonate aldolase (KDO 8-P synthase)